MKNPIHFLFTLIIILGISACDKENCIEGHGSVVSEVLFSPPFEGIRSKGSLEVFIEHGDFQEVKAVGHPNIIDRLQLDAIGDILNIDLQSDCYRDYELAIYITTPSIATVILDGSGDVTIAPMQNESDLLLEIEGSGHIDFNAMTGVANLDVRIDGSGTVRGFADLADLTNLSIDIEGSGDYRGFDVITENCEVHISGSGDSRVHASENLNVTISGSGDVFYQGNPVITSNISGSGDIINAN